jgi:hypothetical protein
MTGSTLFTLILGTLLSSIVSSAHAEGGGPSAPATSQEASAQRTNAMKISVKVQETEKISNLPRRLSTEGAPAGSDPSIGDIAYYSPWGNLAIFYRDFRYSSGLIKLGKIDSGIEALNVTESAKVTIELIDKSE